MRQKILRGSRVGRKGCEGGEKRRRGDSRNGLQGETRGEAEAATTKNEMDGRRRTEGRRRKRKKKNDCGLGLGGWLGADGGGRGSYGKGKSLKLMHAPASKVGCVLREIGAHPRNIMK
jgi:hypothetical protein